MLFFWTLGSKNQKKKKKKKEKVFSGYHKTVSSTTAFNIDKK